MPNTYTQIYIQFVFAVKNRQALIHKEWKDQLHAYITGIFQNNKHKMLQINSVEDHIHIFVGFKPHQSMSAIIQNVKTESSKWINERKFTSSKFEWQRGFGAFSYSKHDAKRIIQYIINQEAHHRKTKFLDEYRYFLREFEIEWDEQYIFNEPQ